MGLNEKFFASSVEVVDSAPTQLDTSIPNFTYSSNTAGKSNCRIVSSTTGYYSTRTSAGFTNGKFYCEMKFISSSVYSSGRGGCGIGNASMNLNSYLGTDANSAGLLTKPNMILFNSSYLGTSSDSYANGSVVMMAYDADERKLFIGHNGTWSALTGSPSSGSGSILPNDDAPFYFAAWGYTSTDSVEFNFYGSDMTYTVPSGYTTA